MVRKICYIAALVLSWQGCTPKPQLKRATDSEFNLGTVSQPQVAKFDAELQNEIFLDVLNRTNGGQCAEDKARPELRLVTADEYIKTVQAVFPFNLNGEALKAMLPVQTTVLGYDHLRQFNVLSPEKLESYMNANKSVAAAIKEQGQNILNCGQDEKKCVEDWLRNNLKKLWQIDIDETILEKETAVFVGYGGGNDGLATLVERLLLSPYFLYQRHLGLQGELNDFEVASLLASSLWASPTSQDLLDKASRGELSSAQQVRGEVERMIADGNFFEGVKRFANAWLTTKVIDGKNFGEINQQQIDDQVKAELKDESANYLYYLTQSEQDDLTTMFTANFTVGGNRLGQIYGFQGDGQQIQGLEQGVQKLTFPEGRVGLVSQPSVAIVSSNLAKTNPALRGKHILEKFLCHNLETPENLNDVVANTQFDQNVSVIEAFDKATNVGSCGECHQYVNGVGFGMENISSAGFFQDVDNHQRPVVPDGELISLTGQRTPFNGIAGLGQALASTKDVEVCLTVQAFRMVYGRLEEKRDVCTITNAYQQASENGLSFRDLFIELILKKTNLQ